MKLDVKCLIASLAGLFFATTGGCSVLVDPDRSQCSTDADCTKRGALFRDSVCVSTFCQPSQSWACLDSPPSSPVNGGPFLATFLLTDAVNQQPKAGISVKLCRKLDVTCAESIAAPVVSDAEGRASFQVANGFDGYARLEGGDVLQTLYFFNPPVRSDRVLPASVGSPASIAGIASLLGAQLSPDRGVVLLATLDCTGKPAPGVVIGTKVADPVTKAFYSQSGFPTAMATSTDADGYGGILNAAPGTATLTASLASNGRLIDQLTVLVQPNTITISALVPNGG